MKNLNVILNSLLIIVCLYFFWITFSFTSSFGQEGVGPAFFPRIALLAVVILASVQIIKSLLAYKREEEKDTQGNNSKKKQLILFISIIVFFVVTFKLIPFLVVSIISLLLMGIVLKMKILTAVLFSSSISIIVFVVFTQGFNILL